MTVSNWTSPDAPCARYDSLRSVVLGDIGVNIDVSERWANGFRHALAFWNVILAARFHEEADLDACSIRIIHGGPEILSEGIIARSQLTDRDDFRGKIAVSETAAQEMTTNEIYSTAVHEIGHMLGLEHNTDAHSVMYFLDCDGSEVLDRKDLAALSRRHMLRPEMRGKSRLPLAAVLPSTRPLAHALVDDD